MTVPHQPSRGAVPLVGNRLDALAAHLSRSDGLLLCLDYDGTLAPIAEHPDDAEMPAHVRETVADLAAVPAVEVAIVSGRSLADLRDRVPVADVHYAGNHGLELAVDGTKRTLSEAETQRDALDGIVADLRDRLADVPGCTVEHKGRTATVHYRQVPDTHVEAVRARAVAVVDDADAFQSTPGKQILEIRPADARGKDHAVRVLREHYDDHFPVYVGDDTTDEDAFRELGTAGVGVHVGNGRETDAAVRVHDTDGVASLLSWFAETGVDRLDATTQP